MDEPILLWWADLDAADSTSLGPELARSLSAEEQARALRLHRPLDRRRFRTARGWLRRLLGAELDCAPDAVRLVTGDAGKPGVAGSELRFSAARSEGVALYVVSRRMEVGVDVEAIRTGVDLDGIARRFFSAAEQRALAALAAERRADAVYACWTRKEAYVKGTGTGLGVDLSSVDVWRADGGAGRVGDWTVHQLDFRPGFAAAVAGAELGGIETEDWRPGRPRALTAEHGVSSR